MQAVTIHCDDIRMEFGIEQCAILIKKSEKQQMTEGRELLNQEKILKNPWRKGNLQILGNIGLVWLGLFV